VKKANISIYKGITVETISANLKTAFKEYAALKKQASSLRNTFLEHLARSQAQDRNLNEISHLKTLREREWQHLIYRHIRAVNQPDRQFGGLTMVLQPNGDECHTKESIEQACLTKNQSRFNQAADTPLLQPPLYGLLGPLGMGCAAMDILQGSFLYPENQIIQDTLNALQHCDPENTLGPTCIHLEDYHNIWRKSKEKTSSCSKYGLHFGHYKAITHDDNLTELHTMMINVTLMSGYSPTRWHVGLNVMIPKKPGNYMVMDLRTLLLYDAEFNATLKWLGRVIMQQAETLNTLAPEQYGSRVDHAAIYQSLNMQLTYDLIWQQRLTAAVCSNDAKACYDRIVHAFACLALLRLGIPIGPIAVMLGMIQLLHHFI